MTINDCYVRVFMSDHLPRVDNTIKIDLFPPEIPIRKRPKHMRLQKLQINASRWHH